MKNTDSLVSGMQCLLNRGFMKKVELTEEEKRELVDKTNDLLIGLDILNADIKILRKIVNSFSPFDAFSDKDYRHTHLVYENRLLEKYRESLKLTKRIKENERILGINKNKRKRRLIKNKTL